MDLPGADLRELREAIHRTQNTTCAFLPAEESNGDGYSDDDFDDYDYDDPGPSPQPVEVVTPSRWTGKGAVILVDQVPPAVAEDASSFTACMECGFVLWPVTLDDMFLYD